MKIYQVKDFPPEFCAPCDYLLRAKAVCMREHFFQVSNLERDRISLGRHARSDMFDSEKLKESEVYVDRYSFSGAGMYYGTEDVIYSFHINRCLLGTPEDDAFSIYYFYMSLVQEAISDLGINTEIKTETKRRKNSGVCLDLDGRGEIVTKDGKKLVASVYHDDGLIVSIHGSILVSDSWAKIYDFLKSHAPRVTRAYSLKQLVSELNTSVVMSSLLSKVGAVDLTDYTPEDKRAMTILSRQFEYERWQA